MKSFLGWLLLLVALAVPAVFFYNWWSKMQASKMEANAPKIKEGAFGKVRSNDTGGLPNPIQSEDGPAGGKDMTPPDGVAGSTTAVAETAAEQPHSGGPLTAELARGAASSPPAGRSEGMEAPVRRKAARGPKILEYNPQTNRDPTLSVLDIKILAIREEARRKALLPPPPPPKPKPAPKPKKQAPPPVWTQISVQGIISTPNGRAAIVNDEVRYVGDEILGASVKKITSSTVIFNIKGKTFYKKVQ